MYTYIYNSNLYFLNGIYNNMKTSGLGSYNTVGKIIGSNTDINVRGLLVGISAAAGFTAAIAVRDREGTVTNIEFLSIGTSILPIAVSAVLGFTAYGSAGNTMAVYGLR